MDGYRFDRPGYASLTQERGKFWISKVIVWGLPMHPLFRWVRTSRLLAGMLLALWAAVGPSLLVAQNTNTGGNTGGNTNTGTNTTNGATFGGVFIGADGKMLSRAEKGLRGSAARRKAAERRNGPQEVAEVSELRKISLKRLEAAVATASANGEELSEEMINLAGLTKVSFVFIYPSADKADSGDIVLAGPAEPWGTQIDGRNCGQKSGQPTLQLHDLILALRVFAKGSSSPITCSIDPTPEGLVRLQEYLNSLGGRIPNDISTIKGNLVESLGKHNVTVGGIPATTHMAHVLVEADYRMKLIGIGLEKPGVDVPSYVSYASGAGDSAMQRWWFVPDEHCLRVSEDGLALELVGRSVKLVGEGELVGSDGSRSGTGGQSRASKAFTTGFTKNYDALASVTPVYAQLRNVIDMAVAAAYLAESKAVDKTGWQMEAFLNPAMINLEVYPAPTQVDAAANVLWKGKRLMTPIGGGVNIDTERALALENRLEDTKGALGDARSKVDLGSIDAAQWWWD